MGAVLDEARVVLLQVNQRIVLLQAQGDGRLDHVPGNALSAWRDGQRTVVLPARSKGASGLDQRREVNLGDLVLDLLLTRLLGARLGVFDQVAVSSSGKVDLLVQSRDKVEEGVGLGLELEQEAHNSERAVSGLVDQVELTVREMVVDTVLGGGVEVEVDQVVLLALDSDRVGVVVVGAILPLTLDSVAVVAAEDVAQGLVLDGQLLLDQGHVGGAKGNVDGRLAVACAADAEEGVEGAPMLRTGVILTILES